jgi:hypothetical protein
MNKILHSAITACFLGAATLPAFAQTAYVTGDPIAYGQSIPGYDLLAELTDAEAKPKTYREAENLDLEIRASHIHLDLAKEKKVEFSARTEWATKFVWKFGDGSTMSGFQHVQHEFSAPGTYEVTLIASDDKEVAKQTIQVIVLDKSEPLELEEMEQFYVFPANNKLEAEFQLNLPRKEKHLVLEMKNISGDRVYQFEIGKVRKHQKIKVDLQNLEAGKYYAVLKGKKYSLVSRITVAK